MVAQTKNSTYIIDTGAKEITGGIFRDKIFRYETASFIVGDNGYIVLANGQTISTSPVIKVSGVK